MALALVVEKLEGLDPAVAALYVKDGDKFKLDVSGIEDVGGLKSALEKERDASKNAAKTLKELQEKFKDIDPVKYKELMTTINSSEDAKLIAEGKLDEVIERRTQRLREEMANQLAAREAEVKAANERTSKYSQRVLDNHIRAGAAAAGLHAHAIDDALLRARSIFTLNDNGDAVQLGTDGKPVLGKDGKSPFTPAEWLETMKATAPHWFPAGSGGSGAGGNGGAGGAKEMKRAHFDGLNAGDRAQALKDGVKIVD